MPKVDAAALTERNSSGYPEQFKAAVAGRYKKALGDAAGLRQFGVNLTRIAPGSGTAMRHWHETEDEFVYVLDGELVLIEGDEEITLTAGDSAGFPAGVSESHCLINRSGRDALLLEVGTRSDNERVHFPDAGLVAEKTDTTFRFVPDPTAGG